MKFFSLVNILLHKTNIFIGNTYIGKVVFWTNLSLVDTRIPPPLLETHPQDVRDSIKVITVNQLFHISAKDRPRYCDPPPPSHSPSILPLVLDDC